MSGVKPTPQDVAEWMAAELQERDKSNEMAVRGHMCEIGDDQALVGDLNSHCLQILVGSFQKLFEHTQFVYDFER
jgi:hypothetical protein